jgi:hypothetical protein
MALADSCLRRKHVSVGARSESRLNAEYRGAVTFSLYEVVRVRWTPTAEREEISGLEGAILGFSTMDATEAAVRGVVDLLVRDEYDALERVTSGVRRTASEIERSISEYGRVLVAPDAGWWELVQVTPVEVEPGTLHVAAPLWTEEDGRSDLTVELELKRSPDETFRASLLDIHAL